MSIIIKKKVTPAKTSGGLKVTSTTKKKYTPIKQETGDKSYGKVGKPGSTSPERKAMNLAIVKARVEGKNSGVAESGKYKGKAYAAGGTTYDHDRKLSSDLKITPPTATFTVTKKPTSSSSVKHEPKKEKGRGKTEPQERVSWAKKGGRETTYKIGRKNNRLQGNFKH